MGLDGDVLVKWSSQRGKMQLNAQVESYQAQWDRIIARRLGTQKLTLGLSELVLLNTGLDSLVELRVKDALGSDVDLVVRLNVLLDSLTTKIGGESVSGLVLE